MLKTGNTEQEKHGVKENKEEKVGSGPIEAFCGFCSEEIQDPP